MAVVASQEAKVPEHQDRAMVGLFKAHAPARCTRHSGASRPHTGSRFVRSEASGSRKVRGPCLATQHLLSGFFDLVHRV